MVRSPRNTPHKLSSAETAKGSRAIFAESPFPSLTNSQIPRKSVFLDSLMWEKKRKECHPSRGVYFCRTSMGQDFVDALFGNRPGN